MNNQNFEQELRSTLHTCADQLEAPEALDSRITFALHQPHRRPMWRKRMVGLAAAALVAVGALAAGVSGMITGHSPADQRLDLDETTKQLTELSTDASLVSALPDDFTFQYGYTSKGTAEFDGKSEAFSSVHAVYQANGVELTLSAHQPYTVFNYDAEIPQTGHSETKTIHGVALTFNETPYLFAPDGYTPTEEEAAAQAAGELCISYGSSESDVQRTSQQSVSWEANGLCCSLSGLGTNLTAEELFALASALI